MVLLLGRCELQTQHFLKKSPFQHPRGSLASFFFLLPLEKVETPDLRSVRGLASGCGTDPLPLEVELHLDPCLDLGIQRGIFWTDDPDFSSAGATEYGQRTHCGGFALGSLGPAARTLENKKKPASQHTTLSVMLCHFRR